MSIFYFKHFHLHQSNSLLKVGTDAMILGASIDVDEDCKSILDIGTGTGVLALMLSKKSLQSTIYAVEQNIIISIIPMIILVISNTELL